MIEPYRLFFPLGVIYAIAGAALWIAAAAGWLPYPAELHRMLMIEGFEQAFIAGFLLTAIPGLTHSEKARPAETAAALGALALFGALAVAGLTAWAHVAFAASVAVLVGAALRRLPRATLAPPVEFAFVALGLALGLVGALWLALQAMGRAPGPAPRFAEHLLSLGMVLSLVLGVGGLLVPTFSGVRDPLVIPFIAAPHERRPRFVFYGVVIAALIAAFVLEAAGHPGAGALVRALAGSSILLLVWKLASGPGRRDLSAFAMWGAGVCVFAGLWLLVLLPGRPMAGLHVVFIGGFGLLTFAIGTRVVVAHGRHGLAAEPHVFGPLAAAGVAGAFLVRLAAERFGAHAFLLYGIAGALWSAAWILWGAGALPRIVRVNAPASRATVTGPGAGQTGGPAA